MKSYNIVIEKDEDGIYVGSVPSMPGCHSDGETIDELLENLKEAILLWEDVHSQENVNPLEFVGVQMLKV
jgi:predicted RNase H-like HicB family nuclease